jgi:hypothetical protein
MKDKVRGKAETDQAKGREHARETRPQSEKGRVNFCRIPGRPGGSREKKARHGAGANPVRNGDNVAWMITFLGFDTENGELS